MTANKTADKLLTEQRITNMAWVDDNIEYGDVFVIDHDNDKKEIIVVGLVNKYGINYQTAILKKTSTYATNFIEIIRNAKKANGKILL